MIIDLKLKPYAECDNEEDNIYEFDDDEWDLIADMFERLVRNFKQAYPKVKINKLETLNNPYINIDLEKDEFIEEELDYFIEVLSGFVNENIIFFDDTKYIIRCQLEENKEKEVEKENPIDKFNRLVEDLAPELIDNE